MQVFLENSRPRIEKAFEELTVREPGVMEPVQRQIGACREKTALAVKYLYAAMPFSDIGNYPFSAIQDFAAHSVMLWERYPRVRKLSEEMFLNYVLFHRVNEEEVAPCRTLFYQSILQYGKDGWTDRRAVGEDWLEEASEEETALEVNFWCGREASYQTADERTISALTVYRTGRGRCGEESVFAVSALRSVGLAARQVYVPRWSHCDDNHAWVEVWVNGGWHYLGACEPSPRLDQGWFNGASSRAMMVHSRWFDDRKPQGELVSGGEGMVTLLNQLARYADTTKVEVLATDETGAPVPDAAVMFQVLNYGELSNIAVQRTDETGRAFLTTGFGSLFVAARKDGLRGEAMLDARTETFCACTLSSGPKERDWTDFDMYAPKDHIRNRLVLSPQEKEAYEKKLARVNAYRIDKVAHFKNEDRERFLALGGPRAALREKLLDALNEKDQLDLRCSVLESHFQEGLAYEGTYPEEIYVPYILNPRICYEVLTPWRKEIREAFTKEEAEGFRKDPASIWEAVKNRIGEQPGRERSSIYTTPAAALRLGVASALSKKVLFVAIARTFGIPARLNPLDRNPEYWQDGSFCPVLPGEDADARLILKEDQAGTQWVYAQNWSIGRFRDKDFESLDLWGYEWDSQEQTSLALVPGIYRLLTANRLPNGNLFAKEKIFKLGRGETKEITMELRKAELSDLISRLTLPDFELQTREGRAVLASELAKDKSILFIWLEEGKEPTEHILNELMERREEFKACADRVALIIRGEEALQDPTLSKCLGAIPGIPVYCHDFGGDMETLARGIYTEPGRLPLIILAKAQGAGLTALYGTSGYNVGTGDMALRLLHAEI